MRGDLYCGMYFNMFQIHRAQQNQGQGRKHVCSLRTYNVGLSVTLYIIIIDKPVSAHRIGKGRKLSWESWDTHVDHVAQSQWP